MKKLLYLVILLTGISFSSEAQFSRYIIKLKDKAFSPYTLSNPSQYLGPRALARRTRYSIPIDSSDLPVTPRYLDSIRLSGNVIILNTSKWLNQVAIQTTDAAALAKINTFPFVIASAPIAARAAVNPFTKRLDVPGAPAMGLLERYIERNAEFYNYGKSNGQVKIHNADFLHDHGFRGEGMQMVVLDAGFLNFLTLPTFDSLRNNGQLLGTWDFVENETSVNEDNYHGMQCLSTIAANIPGVFVGTSPKTSFYLFRTEDVNSEYPIEEQNWAAGMERADSLGVDISSTSLGYTQFDDAVFDYTYADMNGDKTISARAADFAAKKGMLVVTALGNEGNNSWHYLATPSDADSTLSVGAVDTTGRIAGFSSYGPSSDGDIKPSVASVGLSAVVANTTTGLPSYNNGTSFACPNMAGVTSCLWQAFPEINNMGIIDALQQSASLATAPDDRIGYGIPDAKKAFVILIKRLFSNNASINNCNADFNLSVKTDNSMSVEIERKSESESVYTVVKTLQTNTAFSQQNFTFSDDLNSFETGNVKYRIRMDISSDTSFYLDSLMLNYSQSCVTPTENSVTIKPNPVSDFLNLSISRTTAVKLDLVIQNAAGQTVYRNNFQQQAGTQTRIISMKSFSKGIYFVSVFDNNKKVTTKRIVKR